MAAVGAHGGKGGGQEEQDVVVPWFSDLGPNDAYLQEMYNLYLQDPALVGESWVKYFEQLGVPTRSHQRAAAHQVLGQSAGESTSQNGNSSNGLKGITSCAFMKGETSSAVTQPLSTSSAHAMTQERVYRMISAFRGRGHLKAKINPLTKGVPPLPTVEDIHVDFYRFPEDLLDEQFYCSGLGQQEQMTLREIIEELHTLYCGSIGFEFTHLLDQNERLWLQERIENRFKNGYQLSPDQKIHRLRKAIEAEAFESELHRKYVGHKRFSVQGTETLIPMLDNLLEEAAIEGVKKVIFGMPHRGRLNVLVNILGKPLKEIFSEFEDQSIHTALGSGDVKYHMGFESTYRALNGKELELALIPNPSHLEFINPVVEGVARAFQDYQFDRDRKAVLPVLLHGDAAFAGQGVVFETINMSRVHGYMTGGTVHIVVNNQVGFTTDPEDSRSSVYCSDMAKAVQAPVFHVNCEDVESACWAVKTALDFRNRYGRDVIVDLYGYRKYGHNEGDDPSFTQPVTYTEIKDKKNIAQIYAEKLNAEGLVPLERSAEMLKEYKERFELANVESANSVLPGEACAVHGRLRDPSPETGVPLERLQEIASTLTEFPEGFTVHPKLKAILQKRVESLEQGEGIDWGFAEGLAFGSLQQDGVPIRLSGQDCGRGTFSQRHLALSHYHGGPKYFPLKRLEERGGASFEVFNSTLSEAAVVGFEFGYSASVKNALVLWEAQFGDFANGAQVHIDQFIVSSESKWGQKSGLVMLLPHGYEGQGPEHSSARLERYLQLCAEGNIFVCYPSSGAQYFHLLRRQGLLNIKRPLIVMTPKSLLRLPEAASRAEDLVQGAFQTIIPESFGAGSQKKKQTVVLLSGKIYYDVKQKLEQNAKELKNVNLSIIRLEQLYPFPKEELEAFFDKCSLNKLLFVQEEPENQGAWRFVDGRMRKEFGFELTYLGRPESASTATGSGKRHALEQAKILSDLLEAILAG